MPVTRSPVECYKTAVNYVEITRLLRAYMRLCKSQLSDRFHGSAKTFADFMSLVFIRMVSSEVPYYSNLKDLLSPLCWLKIR